MKSIIEFKCTTSIGIKFIVTLCGSFVTAVVHNIPITDIIKNNKVAWFFFDLWKT